MADSKVGKGKYEMSLVIWNGKEGSATDQIWTIWTVKLSKFYNGLWHFIK